MDKTTPKSDVFKANRDRAAPLLARLKADGIRHMIDGKSAASISGASFETKSPIDGAVLASVARGNAEDIDRAATAAALAFKSWRDMPAPMRKKLLHRVADAIEDRADDIAVLECIDTGQAHRFMAKAAIRAAENFRFFADKCADARDGQNMPSEEHWNISTRVPIGPVGVITPWNTPFMLSTWKIAPALAAGCTVVHKPAEWSPVTADLLAKLVKQAGVPDGVLNTVHGIGEEAGKALKVGHPLDPATEIGPLIHERHLAKVCSYFDVARKDGATIAVGGKPHDGPGGGHYVQPTLVTGAHSKMRVAQEEVFGPFLTVIPSKDEKQAIEIANGVQY